MGRNLEVERLVKEAKAEGHGDTYIATWLGQRGFLRDDGQPYTRHNVRCMMSTPEHDALPGLQTVAEWPDKMEVSGLCQARSLEALLELMDVDLDVWYVDRWVGNQWGKGNLWQIKAWFKRLSTEESTIVDLIHDLRENPLKESVVEATTEHMVRMADTLHGDRMLEIAISDPHYGMRCFAGPSGAEWSPELAERYWWSAYHELVNRATPFGVKDCTLILGNDFLHADNVFHTTTQGTGQPEMESWHAMVRRGRRLLLETVRSALYNFSGKVRVVFVPGNHARQTEFLLGLLVESVFANNPRVYVDAGPEPYKFVRYGCNLIGYDHGHSINPVRLGGIMAEERKEDWAQTTYREWHLGDQHRKGVSRPSMEELGVSIEYLPSLIPWNEWHKIKGFSQQKRAAVAFVYDVDEGCIAKLQWNPNDA